MSDFIMTFRHGVGVLYFHFLHLSSAKCCGNRMSVVLYYTRHLLESFWVLFSGKWSLKVYLGVVQGYVYSLRLNLRNSVGSPRPPCPISQNHRD